MKNELSMALFSRLPITEEGARKQIEILSDFEGGLLCPDKCNEFEPIKFPFNRSDITEPIQWLSKPHGNFFYRKGSPVHLSGEIRNRTHPQTARFPSPLFCNRWTGRF